MKISVLKLIRAISKYDYINFVTLASAAEEIETTERIEKEIEMQRDKSSSEEK